MHVWQDLRYLISSGFSAWATVRKQVTSDRSGQVTFWGGGGGGGVEGKFAGNVKIKNFK